jgi:hypothetical protein
MGVLKTIGTYHTLSNFHVRQELFPIFTYLWSFSSEIGEGKNQIPISILSNKNQPNKMTEQHTHKYGNSIFEARNYK